MGLIRRLLEQSLEDKSFVGVFTDPDDTYRFSMGIVLAVGREGYALQTVARDGSWDPLHVGRLELVTRVSRDTPYLQMLAAVPRPPLSEFGPVAPDIAECLEKLAQEHHVITIINEDDEATHATILEVDGEEFLFTEITREGETDGEEARRIDSIRRLEMNGPPQRAMERLLWSDKLGSL